VTKLALAFFVVAVIIGVGLAVYTSLNSDESRDPVRDPQPISLPE
jgi:hypothetical protein